MFFDRNAEIISQYAWKGRQVSLIGRMNTRSYEVECECGKKHTCYVTEFIVSRVILLGKGNGNGKGKECGCVKD